MNKYLLCMGMGICMAGLLVRVEAQAADENVVKDVDKASKDATTKKWDDVVKEAAPLAKKYDPEQVMEMMSKRNPDNPKKGGVGIGGKPGAVDPDGIEAKIINMIRQGIPQGEMANLDDFKKMADQVATIAAITQNHTPEKKKDDPGGAIWKKTSADMFEKSKDFKKAVEAKDQAKIKAAAKALDGTCKECHNVYKP